MLCTRPFDPGADCPRCQRSTIAFVCGHRGHRGAIVGTRGSQRAIEPRPTASIWHGSWRSRRFPRRKLCRANKIPMIISLHSFLWDYHHFAGNWSDVLTAQQSSRCLLFVKYCSTLPLPFIHIQTSFILEAFPGCVFCLPRLSSV